MSLQYRPKVVILGAGGFAREVLWAIKEEGAYEPVGFLDEDIGHHGNYVCGLPIIGTFDALNTLRLPSLNYYLVCGVGAPLLKKRFVDIAPRKLFLGWASVKAPGASMSGFVSIGEGSIITAGCILTTQVKVGKHVNLNLDCTVGHDSTIGDFSNISPGVHISGHVTIEEGVDIGTGASILPGIKIGAGSIVGASACVTKDVPPYVVVAGVPAKVIRMVSDVTD